MSLESNDAVLTLNHDSDGILMNMELLIQSLAPVDEDKKISGTAMPGYVKHPTNILVPLIAVLQNGRRAFVIPGLRKLGDIMEAHTPEEENRCIADWAAEITAVTKAYNTTPTLNDSNIGPPYYTSVKAGMATVARTKNAFIPGSCTRFSRLDTFMRDIDLSYAPPDVIPQIAAKLQRNTDGSKDGKYNSLSEMLKWLSDNNQTVMSIDMSALQNYAGKALHTTIVMGLDSLLKGLTSPNTPENVTICTLLKQLNEPPTRWQFVDFVKLEPALGEPGNFSKRAIAGLWLCWNVVEHTPKLYSTVIDSKALEVDNSSGSLKTLHVPGGFADKIKNIGDSSCISAGLIDSPINRGEAFRLSKLVPMYLRAVISTVATVGKSGPLTQDIITNTLGYVRPFCLFDSGKAAALWCVTNEFYECAQEMQLMVDVLTNIIVTQPEGVETMEIPEAGTDEPKVDVALIFAKPSSSVLSATKALSTELATYSREREGAQQERSRVYVASNDARRRYQFDSSSQQAPPQAPPQTPQRAPFQTPQQSPVPSPSRGSYGGWAKSSD